MALNVSNISAVFEKDTKTIGKQSVYVDFDFGGKVHESETLRKTGKVAEWDSAVQLTGSGVWLKITAKASKTLGADKPLGVGQVNVVETVGKGLQTVELIDPATNTPGGVIKFIITGGSPAISGLPHHKEGGVLGAAESKIPGHSTEGTGSTPTDTASGAGGGSGAGKTLGAGAAGTGAGALGARALHNEGGTGQQTSPLGAGGQQSQGYDQQQQGYGAPGGTGQGVGGQQTQGLGQQQQGFGAPGGTTQSGGGGGLTSGGGGVPQQSQGYAGNQGGGVGQALSAGGLGAAAGAAGASALHHHDKQGDESNLGGSGVGGQQQLQQQGLGGSQQPGGQSFGGADGEAPGSQSFGAGGGQVNQGTGGGYGNDGPQSTGYGNQQGSSGVVPALGGAAAGAGAAGLGAAASRGQRDQQPDYYNPSSGTDLQSPGGGAPTQGYSSSSPGQGQQPGGSNFSQFSSIGSGAGGGIGQSSRENQPGDVGLGERTAQQAFVGPDGASTGSGGISGTQCEHSPLGQNESCTRCGGTGKLTQQFEKDLGLGQGQTTQSPGATGGRF